MTDTERRIIEKVGTLNCQEAKVVLLMREVPYQTIIVKMENGKIVHKEQIKSIKD